MAGVVASKVRKQRANSNPGQVREQRSEEETFKKRQIKVIDQLVLKQLSLSKNFQILNAQLQGYSNSEVPRVRFKFKGRFKCFYRRFKPFDSEKEKEQAGAELGQAQSKRELFLD